MRNNTTYKTLIENKEYQNTFPIELTDIWKKRGICSLKGNLIVFKITGLLIYKKIFLIIFPKSYKLPTNESNEKKHIQVLAKVLIKYKDEGTLDPIESELLGGDNGQYINNLLTVYQLIQDFLQNGYLVKETLIKSGYDSGKIDWPSTINKKQPVFSGSSVVYFDPIFQKKIVDHQNLLLTLHKYCIFKGIDEYGWLLGLSTNLVEPMNNLLSNYDLNFLMNFLIKELNSTFVDREIKVIKLLIQYLSGINHENIEEKLETLATPYFQNVWETMCSANFKNQYHLLKQIIPKLNWEIDSNARVQPQRPDLIMIREKTLYILDAKYYNVDKNLPGWGDIVKQLFYAFTIYTNIKSNKNLKSNIKLNNITNVYNAFLFPSSDTESIKYIGKVEVEGNEELGNVKAFKLNTFLMMRCYIGIEKYSFMNNFIEASNETL